MGKDENNLPEEEGDLSFESKSESPKNVDIIELAARFDKNTSMDKKYASYVEQELQDGETPLYAAKTTIAVNGSLDGYENLKSVAAVLTESRFFYIGTKAGTFSSAFGKPTAKGSVPLDEITALSMGQTGILRGGMPYLKISTMSDSYEMEIPYTSALIGGASKQEQSEEVLKIFENARKSFLGGSDVADDPFDAADPDPFSDLGEPAPQKNSTSLDDLEQLEKLASLRDRGIITEEEFQAKKKQILGL